MRVFRPGRPALRRPKARSSPPACNDHTGSLSILQAEPRFVYVASPDSVVRFPYRSGDMKASGPAEMIASLPSGGGHWTRDLAFAPDDRTLFVSVGSGSNVHEGVPPRTRPASPKRRRRLLRR